MPFSRGARPSPRHKLAAAMPHVPVTPTPANIIYNPSELSMWLNSTYGDCCTAEEAFAKACYTPEIFIADAEVEAWAKAHNALNGAVISDILEWMEQNGFSQNNQLYNDGPHTSIDWTNSSVLQNAIAQGPVKLGVAADQLESVVEAHPSSGWVATGFATDQNLDHCVSLCGFGTFEWLADQLKVTLPPSVNLYTPGYAMFTWDSIGLIDSPSLLAITGEAWLRNPTTIIRTT